MGLSVGLSVGRAEGVGGGGGKVQFQFPCQFAFVARRIHAGSCEV